MENALRAAEIIAKCPQKNLPYVLEVLSQAGFDLELDITDEVYIPNEEASLRENLDFKLDQSQWRYLAASEISLELFEDTDHAQIIGRVLIDKFGYTKKNEGQLRHFRIINGIKKYFIPML